MIFTLLVGIGVQELLLLFAYLLLCFFIAKGIGAKRTIGFLGSFILCILFSPLIGLIIILLFKKKS